MWKNRFFYLALLVYSTILAVLYNVYNTAVAAVVLWLLPFVLLLFLAAGQALIKGKPYPVGELVKKGELLGVGFFVENRGYLPGFPGKAEVEIVSAFGGSREKRKKTVVLKAHGVTKVSLPVKAAHCGRMEILYKGFWLFDYFRLWSVRKIGKAAYTVRVMPELRELTGWYHPVKEVWEEDNERFSETKAGDDVSEIFGFHEYRPGDRISGIHWKLSSKKEELIVKEYSLPLTVTTGIWFDFRKNPVSEEEAGELDEALSALFSLSMALLQRKYSHYVYFAGNRFLIENEEDISLVFDEIYGQGFQKSELFENPAPNLFYIGQEKNRERLREESGRNTALWMVNTKQIESILEDINEQRNL